MAFQESYRTENQDKMYKFYHHYFTDKYIKKERPTKDDALIVESKVGADIVKGKVKYWNPIKKKHYDYIMYAYTYISCGD